MRRFYKNKWRGGSRFAGFIPAHYREIWNGSTPVNFVSVAADTNIRRDFEEALEGLLW